MPVMDPAQLLESATRAWSFVQGAGLRFQQHDQVPAAPGDTWLLVLPVGQARHVGDSAVGVLLPAARAESIARHMFAQPDGDLARSDVEDAALEACNVLAASVMGVLGAPESLRIGLPRHVAGPEYQGLIRTSALRACLVGVEDGPFAPSPVVIAVYEALRPMHLESAV